MSLIYIALMLTTCSLAIFLYKHAEAYQNTPHRSGNVEKSDENQETQSTGIAKNPLNFEYAEGELNICASASFKYM